MLFFLVGCTASNEEDSSFIKSSVNKEVPVPANAKSSSASFNNPNIKKGKTYKLDDIGGEQGLYRPQKYFEELKMWGWEELKREQMGSVYFFKKGETIIAIIIKEDYFQLYEMKEGYHF